MTFRRFSYVPDPRVGQLGGTQTPPLLRYGPAKSLREEGVKQETEYRHYDILWCWKLVTR
jgi:hypothetical protein